MIQEGDKLPAATLHMMKDGRPAAVSTDDLFGGKKVVLVMSGGNASLQHLKSALARSS